MSNPDMAALNWGGPERRAIMLSKLGGKKALQIAIDKFYNRQIHDKRLMAFFEGANVEILKWHQLNLMSIAFTEIPKNVDLKEILLNRHVRLFDEGLSEKHFDLVMTYFDETLEEMKVDPELAKEARQVVLPLREIFVQGAQEAAERRQARQVYKNIHRVVVVLGIAAIVGFRFWKQSSRRK